jgi:hypothetical protein
MDIHLRVVLVGWSWEVDLEGRAQKLLVAEKLQKESVVLCAAADKVHGLAVCCTKFDILAAVVKGRPIIVGHKIVQLGYEELVPLWLRTCDIYEKRLIR